MSVKSKVRRTRLWIPVGKPAHARIPAHSIWTTCSSPTVYPSWPGGMSKTSCGPNSALVPSEKSIPSRPEMTTPTWRAWHHSPPTFGLLSTDQRQPGSDTMKATVRSPSSTRLAVMFGNSITSLGRSRFALMTSAIASRSWQLPRQVGDRLEDDVGVGERLRFGRVARRSGSRPRASRPPSPSGCRCASPRLRGSVLAGRRAVAPLRGRRPARACPASPPPTRRSRGTTWRARRARARRRSARGSTTTRPRADRRRRSPAPLRPRPGTSGSRSRYRASIRRTTSALISTGVAATPSSSWM